VEGIPLVTKRQVNRHRFYIALVVIGVGVVIAAFGAIMEIVNPGGGIFPATLPVATTLISGAAGAIIGGESTTTRQPTGQQGGITSVSWTGSFYATAAPSIVASS